MAGLFILPLTGVGLGAYAQSCTHFLNATDGDDRSAGTAASQAVRTFEHAFNAFPNGAVVCTTAGEYFQGADADGIQLTGSGVLDKSMTFILQAFAGNDVIAITEDEFVVDIGSGTLTFQPGSASQLYFGEGTVNNNSDFPNNTNFLHTIELLSGVVDAEGVNVNLGISTGNPSYVNGGTPAPDGAAIIRGRGMLKGSIHFDDAFRRIKYTEAGDRVAGDELAGLERFDLIFEHTSGTVTVPQQLSFLEGSIVISGSGSARFSSDVFFSEPTSTSITASGAGSLSFTSLAGLFSEDLEWISIGGGVHEIEQLDVRLPAASSDVNVSISNRGELTLRSISTPPAMSGASVELTLFNETRGTLLISSPDALAPLNVGIENAVDATVRVTGESTLSGPVSNAGRFDVEDHTTLQDSLINVGDFTVMHMGGDHVVVTLESVFENTGDVVLDSNELLLSADGDHLNSGSITGGKVVLNADANLTGGGSLSDLEARSGDSRVAMQRINGGVDCRSQANLHLDHISNVAALTINCGLTHTGGLAIAGNLILESGTFILTDTVAVLGDYLQHSGATLQLGSSTLSLAGHFDRRGGAVQVDQGEVILFGSGPQTVEPGPGLQLHDLTAIGSNREIVIASGFELTGILTIGEGTRVMIEDGSIRLAGTQSSAHVSGTLSTSTTAFLEFGGLSRSQQRLEGGGLVGNLLVNLDDDSRMMTVAGDGIRQSGTLTLNRGSLRVAPTASLILTSELGAPHIRRNMGVGNAPEGGDATAIIANTPGAGLLDVQGGLDVSYFGVVTDTVSAGVELHTADIRNLEIDFEARSEQRGTFRIDDDVVLSGNLEVGARTSIDASSHRVIARGTESIHVIDGAFSSGELVVEGAGVLRGSRMRDRWLDQLTIRSEGVVWTDAAGSISQITVETGNLSFRAPEETTVGVYRQQGSDAELYLRSDLSVSNELRIMGGSVVTGSFDVRMGDGSELAQEPEVNWSEEGNGQLIFLGSGRIEGDEVSISRLRLAGEATDTLRLGGALRVLRHLSLVSGLLDAGENAITISAGGEVRIEREGEAVPMFAEGTSYLTEGPIMLTFHGTGGDLTSNDRTFPETADVNELIVRMGDAGDQTARHFRLHAHRTVDRLIVDQYTEDSAFDLNGSTLIVDSTASIASGRITASTDGKLDVGTDFVVESDGSADGMLSATVEGTTTINGVFQGHLLHAYGDVIVTGSLGGPDRAPTAGAGQHIAGVPNLTFGGSNQTLSLTAAPGGATENDDSINRLVIALEPDAETADGPSVSIISDRQEGVVLGVNHVEFVNGLLITGQNTVLLPSDGDGFSRVTPGLSHVVGPVRRKIVSNAQNGADLNRRFAFPVGSGYPHAVYRPVTIIFDEDAPAADAFAITVSHQDAIPGGLRGFPIVGGDDIVIHDTAPFHWIIHSSIDLPPSQSYTIQFLATDLSTVSTVRGVRMLRRNTLERGAGWRLHARPEQYDNARMDEHDLPTVFVQTIGTTDGLSSDTTLFTVGLERQAFNFARVQLIHDLPVGNVDVRVDGDALFSDLQPGEATPFFRVSPGEHDLDLHRDGAGVVGDQLSLRAGNDYIVVASDLDGDRDAAFYVHENARATVEAGVNDNVQITLFNGYASPLNVTFEAGSPNQRSFEGIGPAAFLSEYVTVAPDVLRFDVQSDDQVVSHRTDLRELEGITAVAIVSPDDEEALVFSNDGERHESYTVIAGEKPETLPDRFSVHGNFPNPFNPVTRISFDLPEAAMVRIEVFDMVGRRVMSSNEESLPAGAQRSIKIDARRLPSGVYLFRVTAVSAADSYAGSGTFTLVK